MKVKDLIPLVPSMCLLFYSLPHTFHLPVIRIAFLDTNVSASSITSLMLLYIIAYLLLHKQPMLWRFITTITIVETAFIFYEAVHSSLYYLHHRHYYNPDWTLKMIIASSVLFVVLNILHKYKNVFRFDSVTYLSFCLFLILSLYQVAARWYVAPIDGLSCVIHQTAGFWMWLSLIKVGKDEN